MSRAKYIIATAALAFLGVVLWLAARTSNPGGPPAGPSRANFDRLSEGMTLAEVEAVLGPAPPSSSSYIWLDRLDRHEYYYIWRGRDGLCRVWVVNDRVTRLKFDSSPGEPKSKRTDPAILKALHTTFAKGPDEALLKLVKENPSLVHDMAEYDCTALHYAARYGRVETARWFIEQKADVNTVAYNRFTPMHVVTDAAVAQLLIKAGADLHAKDSWGLTPLQHAADDNRLEVVEAILASGHTMDLQTVMLLKKRDVVKKMLKENPAVAREPTEGSHLGGCKTPLGLACAQRDMELIHLLLDAGADVNEGTHMPNAGGNATALTNAVWVGDKEIVKLLLDRGARTDAVGGKFYDTILDYARKHSVPEIVELLEKAGAKGSD